VTNRDAQDQQRLHNTIPDFISGKAGGGAGAAAAGGQPLSKEAFYAKLAATDPGRLPVVTQVVKIESTKNEPAGEAAGEAAPSEQPSAAGQQLVPQQQVMQHECLVCNGSLSHDSLQRLSLQRLYPTALSNGSLQRLSRTAGARVPRVQHAGRRAGARHGLRAAAPAHEGTVGESR
jgi:hypothetical protein